MRDTIMRAIIFIGLQLTTISVFTQHNNLSPGDIVFVSYQSDQDQGNPIIGDRFSIVVLRDGGIPANAVFYITDVGWNASANSFSSIPEGCISWQVPATGIRQGTEIFFISSLNGPSNPTWHAYTSESGATIIGTTISNINNNPMDISTAGDQLLIYQTGLPGGQTGGYNHSTRRFITAIHANYEPGVTSGTSWDGNIPTTPGQSSLPTGLITGTTAFILSPGPLPGPGDGTTEPDNGKFNCVANGTAFTAAIMAAVIYNPANWNFSNNPFPPGATSNKCPYLIGESLLPVKLISFTARSVDQIIHVKWQTAEETDHDFFEIERSIDGRNYSVMIRIAGANGAGLKNYEWNDISVTIAHSGQIYYRLKMVSMAGKEEYSKTVVVKSGGNGWMMVNNGEIRLHMQAAGKLNLVVSDMNGRILSKEVIQAPKGYSTHVLKVMESVPAGMYFIMVESDGHKMTSKFIK